MKYSCSAYELKCNECGKRFGNQPLSACDDCLAPLEVHYDLEAVRGVYPREDRLPARPTSGATRSCCPSPRLPARPPRRLHAAGRRSGLASASAQTISMSRTTPSAFPTLSFKDRVVSVALANAQAFGFETVGCSSTGNLANSVAAQAARLGLKACILVPPISSPQRSSTRRSTARAWSASTATTTTSTASAP
jgi:threonine synthase